MSDLDDFRREVRAWLDESCPPAMRTPAASEAEEVWGGRLATFPSDDARLWLERMAARGFTAPTWPRQYGGAALSPAQAAVLDEELGRLGCRPALRSLGQWLLAPVLLVHGSEEQKREHLPPIARGQIRWCQGYSEPDAGSDLASLKTRAVRDGDCYVVTGQKVWTSHADRADFMFCLVRTDVSAPRHEGISFLLVDMASPGIRVRPIRLLSGASPFCETFFDEVRVPARNLVGREGGGWAIAKEVLGHERTAMVSLRAARTDEEEPLEMLARRCLAAALPAAGSRSLESSGGVPGEPLPDPILRDRIAQANLDLLANRLTLRRAAERRAAGAPGPESSVLKLYGTELHQRRRELVVEILGYRGLGWESGGFTAGELQATRDWLRSRANTIEGGTSEIQLNIIARRVLGLP